MQVDLNKKLADMSDEDLKRLAEVYRHQYEPKLIEGTIERDKD